MQLQYRLRNMHSHAPVFACQSEGRLNVLLCISRTLRAAADRFGCSELLRQALEPTQHDSLVETVRGTGYRFRRALA